MPDNTLGLPAALTAAEAEPDPAVLRAEFNEIMRESDSGRFNYQGDPNDKEAMAKHAEWVRSRVKRGIELSTILRRQNTGPARAKPAGRGRGKKPAIDQAAILQNLLD